MLTPLFSVSNFLNKDILTPAGAVVGTLIDIIGDERTGKFTYFLLEGKLDKIYAVHHSYFYQLTAPASMIFDQELGNEDYDFFTDLPATYNDIQVHTYADLLQLEIPSLVTADHRSDDEPPI